MSKIPKSVQEFPKVSKNDQECSSLAWVLPFIGSDLFILTSMVMASILMEVIYMYVSIGINLSKFLTRLLCTVHV